MLRRAFDWVFRSREDGRVVLAQAPNAPLWIFLLVAFVLTGLKGLGISGGT